MSDLYISDNMDEDPAPNEAKGLVIDGGDETFIEDVIDGSKGRPVLVDFWAPWCAPCKQLGPVLEKAVRDAKGTVKLVKINIDQDPLMASQLRVQSIPAVFAFLDGAPVDGFMGSLSAPKIAEFVQRVARMAPDSGAQELDALLADAENALSGNDVVTAVQIYTEILARDTGNALALAGLVQCHVRSGDPDAAENYLRGVPEEVLAHPAVAAAQTAIALAREAASAGSPAEFRARLEADPDDHAARFELAMALLFFGCAQPGGR